MNTEVLHKYTNMLAVKVIDKESEKKARAMFSAYLNSGVLYDCSFDDEIWNATDDYSRRSLRFQPDIFLYRRFYLDYLQIPYDTFVIALKVYTMYSFGNLVLNTIQTLINEVERVVSIDPFDLPGSPVLDAISLPQRLSEFFSMLPAIGGKETSIQDLIDVFDESVSIRYSQGQARELASFESYFKFNDIMHEYWSSDISKDERLFYYPLYLWWEVTGVLPLRPKEFLVTPRNCLRLSDDGYYLSIRRDCLKGGNRKVTYKLDTDFEIYEYHIPDKLAKEIQKYLEYTADFDATDIDTLFVTDYHYHKWKQKKHENSRYFTYINMNTVLRYFFEEIIVERLGYKVFMDRGDEYAHMKDDEIQYIFLGDTRHLAMINILAEGGTPVLAMALAGHNNIDISMHYAANLTSLVECRVYRQYKKMLTGGQEYKLTWKTGKRLLPSEFTILDDRSRCYSPLFIKGDFSDCEKVLGANGELGDCSQCPYYRPAETNGFFTNESKEGYKKIIAEDCKRLSEVIALVRKEKGDPEDILQAMMKLHDSTHTYEMFCREKALIDKEEAKDGKEGKK